MFLLFDAVLTVHNFTSCVIVFYLCIRRNVVNKNGLALIFVGLNVWNGCRVVSGRTESTFVATIVTREIQLTPRCFCCEAVWGRIIILPHAPFCFPNIPQRE